MQIYFWGFAVAAVFVFPLPVFTYFFYCNFTAYILENFKTCHVRAAAAAVEKAAQHRTAQNVLLLLPNGNGSNIMSGCMYACVVGIVGCYAIIWLVYIHTYIYIYMYLCIYALHNFGQSARTFGVEIF